MNKRIRAWPILLLGCIGAAAHAQQASPPLSAPVPPSPDAPPATKKTPPIDLVTLNAGYITIRSPKNLAPIGFLFVDLSRLDTQRYQVEAPQDPQTYGIRHESSKPAAHSSDYDNAASALGLTSAGTPKPPTTAGGTAGSPGTSGPTLPAVPSPTPGKKAPGSSEVQVNSAEMVGNTARVFLHGVKRGDRLEVRLRNVTETTPSGATDPVELELDKPVTVGETAGIRIEPNLVFAAGQQLTDGSHKSVIQVPLLIDAPSIKQTGSANYYVRSDNVFSSSGKDPSARLNLTGGIESNIAGKRQLHFLGLGDANHLVPGRTELRLDASQSLTNVAITLDSGLQRRIGGGGPDPLWDAQLRSENAPVLSLDAFLEQRLKKDVSISPRHAGTFNPGLSAGLEAPPINLIATSALPAPIQFLLGGRTWFLPFEKGANGLSPRTIEYDVHAGVLIPLPRVLGGDRRLRLAYVDGAIPASGYVRTKSFQIALEGLTF